MSDTINVNILILSGSPKQVQAEIGWTVAMALEKAGVDGGEYSIQVNGQSAALDTPLEADAYITLVPNIEGGSHDLIHAELYASRNA